MDFRPDEKNVVYIGEGVKIEGVITANDVVVVDGALEGEISCSQLIVGEHGVVTGTVTVSNADIYGKIGPNVTVKQVLVLRSSGRVEGKWTYGELEVERGGLLTGQAEASESRERPTVVVARSGSTAQARATSARRPAVESRERAATTA